MVVSQGLREALSLATANRDNIWRYNLTITRPNNRPIRQALGLREDSSTRKGTPRFAATDVLQLYQEIDTLAKQQLPRVDADRLQNAWETGEYSNAIVKILKDHGQNIWGVPMDRRQPQKHPGSPLLLGKEHELYQTNLFYEISAHFDFIALQLEHLAFVKAKLYHDNHDNHCNQEQIVDSLIVSLSIPGDKLAAITSSHTLNSSKNRNQDDTYKPPRPHRRVIAESEGDEAEGDRMPRRSKRQHRNDNDKESNEMCKGSSEKRSNDSKNNSLDTRAGGQSTANDTSRKRDELRFLLQKEFHLSNSNDVENMWRNSNNVNQCFSMIWEWDLEKNHKELGEQFDDVNATIMAWIHRRSVAGSLGEKIGKHPSQGAPIPRYTWEEWVAKLGGEEAYTAMDMYLTMYRLSSDAERCANTQHVAENICTALASATGYSLGRQAFMKGVLKFNETLFSWKLDLMG